MVLFATLATLLLVSPQTACMLSPLNWSCSAGYHYPHMLTCTAGHTAKLSPRCPAKLPAACSNLSHSCNSPGGGLVPCAQPRLLRLLGPQNDRHAVMQPLQPLAGVCGRSGVTEECRIWSACRSDRGACWARQPCLRLAGNGRAQHSGHAAADALLHTRHVPGEKAACHAQCNTSARTGPSDR